MALGTGDRSAQWDDIMRSCLTVLNCCVRKLFKGAKKGFVC